MTVIISDADHHFVSAKYPQISARAPRLAAVESDALVWAAELHRSQARKGTPIPYLSHLLAVASLVLEDGGDEDEATVARTQTALRRPPAGGVRRHRSRACAPVG